MEQKKTMAFESILSNINQNGVIVSEVEETVRGLEGLANDRSIEAAYVLGRAYHLGIPGHEDDQSAVA